MKYNIWNKWDPLKVCMLGNNYAPEFFNGLDPKVSNPLKRICDETLEDLEGYKEILQDFGAEVIQPKLDPNERFADYLDRPQPFPSSCPRGPLQPRDDQLVLGNKCFSRRDDHPAIVECLTEYGGISERASDYPMIISERVYNILAGDWPSWEDYVKNIRNKDFFDEWVWEELCNVGGGGFDFTSANAFMLGKKLIIGADATDAAVGSIIIPELQDFEVIFKPIDGHTDGCFHPIKPGAIISLHEVVDYNETFPNWDVCYLPDQSWAKVEDFQILKEKNMGKWYLAGETNNDEFIHFVETWLNDWVGYVEETVFDVNVLMLDEHHCCVSNPNNEQVNKFLKKHKVEPVYVPWRHRYFWDGGLHCITLDLYREGSQQDYFNR